ncbi:MAG TPA: 16S rRNA (cytosine(1402)-N(4))-methyltransferase RsmH [Gemmatimonadaceae bacterium]|nr:16S rRNA (cytosine(1402)-N(4))-methyltransferase RsmH [Gemmatimonadaceae bacterium]
MPARARPGTWDSVYHAPVLVDAVVDLLRGASHTLDGTLGGGGHSRALLDAGARVTGVDRDPDAIAATEVRLADAIADGRFRAIAGNYADAGILDEAGLSGLGGVLLDLGVSSHQVDDPARGFSFREGAPLDMRMGPDAVTSAAMFLNEGEEAELMRAFRDYADEPRARRLAREVVRRREGRQFASSDDFVGAIRATLGPRSGAPDFARLFQAVRIAVNDELAGLARALPDLRDRLAPGGRMVVISYHSGEDRLVKHAFRDWSTACICPPRQPLCTCGGVAKGTVLTRRAITASAEESARNPRSRSARLRAWQRAA